MQKFIKRPALILFFTALIFALLFNLKFFGKPPLPGGDDYYYNYATKNLLVKGSLFLNKYEPVVMADSMYPLFLASIYKISGLENYDAVRIAQIILFAFTAILVYAAAKILFRQEKLALAAGFLSAIFFPLAGFTIRLIREPLMAFLIILTIWLLLKAQETNKYKWFALAGFSAGLMALTNSIVQPFILLILFGLALLFGKKFFTNKNLCRAGLLFASFLILVISFLYRFHWEKGTDPLASKTGVLSRKAEMIQDIRGETYFRNLGGLLFGYYFFEKPGFNTQTFLNHRRTSSEMSQLEAEGYSPQEQSAIIFRQGLNIILHNIPRYFAITLLDFLQFNNIMLPNPASFDPAPGQYLFIGGSHQGIPVPVKIIILILLRVVYWLFFGLVIYGLIKALKDWRRFLWPVLIVAYYNLAYSAIFGIPRYSVPIYSFYIIFFVYGFWQFYDKYLKHKINAGDDFHNSKTVHGSIN